jgi:stage V sporulation protein R
MVDEKRFTEVTDLARELGLDPFPVVHEVIERSTMFNICAYGLPARARHWSYGRSYDHQKTHGEMGLSKVYEIILNNNPSYAFMLDTNTEIQNLFIVAHCAGHSHMFKNNHMFEGSNRNMIRHAAEHAGRIEEYISKYGFEKVEHLMDIGFGLCSHIDWHKGLYRKPYGSKKKKKTKRKYGEFDDILRTEKKEKPKKTAKVFPPHPEKDLLWFFINYGPLEEWEKDVLDIIREEHFYFYPQMMTKIMHEGFASYWHAEIMYQYKGITQSEYLDFLRDHEKVVQPGGNPFRINPYFLGYRMFKDIEKRWDESHGPGAGKKKIFEVAQEENDISFIRNYLTADLIEDLKLFTYGYVKDYPKDYSREKYIEIKERMREEVVEALVRPLYNGGSPKIVITEVGPEGKLIMKHLSTHISTLDHRFASKTLEYIWDLWAAPIELHTKDDEDNDLVLCFDEAGYYEKSLDEELDFDEEELDDEEFKKNYRGRIIIP